jgi:hypothetical protein
MSHFTVLVVGPDPEEQLKPFDENKEVKPYPKPYEKKDLQQMLDYYTKEEGRTKKPDISKLATSAKIDKKGIVTGVTHAELQQIFDQWSSGILRRARNRKDGCAYERMTTYNPKSKWDWHQLGGRWNGYFKLKSEVDTKHARLGKPGIMTDVAKIGTADQAYKCDIDFESMRAEAEKKAGERWDRAQIIIAGREKEFKSWDTLRKKHGKNIALAREDYWAQPLQQDARKSKEFAWDGVEEFAVTTREKYVENARRSAISTFAVVKGGKWYERGEMGWWGVVRNEKDHDEWNQQFTKLLNDLPDSTLLSVYDCHI